MTNSDTRQWYGADVPETVNGWECFHSDAIQLKYRKDEKTATVFASTEDDETYTYIVSLPSGSVISYSELDAALERLLGYMRRIDGPPWLRGSEVWTPEVGDE